MNKQIRKDSKETNGWTHDTKNFLGGKYEQNEADRSFSCSDGGLSRVGGTHYGQGKGGSR